MTEQERIAQAIAEHKALLDKYGVDQLVDPDWGKFGHFDADTLEYIKRRLSFRLLFAPRPGWTEPAKKD